MPELPEVETVKETLIKKIIQKKIVRTVVNYSGVLENINSAEFINQTKNQTINDIKRYGKYLIFILDTISLIVHLRMEGKFFILKDSIPYNKHEHIVFYLDDSLTLRYHDTRKFGKFVLLETTDMSEIMKYKALAKLGPEACDEEVSVDYLYDKVHKMNKPIKTVLLEQTLLAGIGNIYADEILFKSKINPLTKATFLKRNQVENILQSSKSILKEAIKEGGTTIRSYTSSLGVTGRFQQHLMCHQRENQPCLICGTNIIKTTVGGRGTYYCPVCQSTNVIGLTGQIGSGKSVVATYLKSHGFRVIDADIISREISNRPEIISKIKRIFGDQYVTDKGINRKKLGDLIFADPVHRKTLNDILHPIILKEIFLEVAKYSNELVVVVVPLLYETGLNEICKKTIMVVAKEEIREQRIVNRDDLTIDEARTRMQSQFSQQKFIDFATFIIDNSFELCYTYKQIAQILLKLKEEI